ncbi:uncharacterized protein LOC122253201 [Penaeus japonicus]|uniref:uncharacterized protein LOC122253201 n=1 Tax=Penaeus japonicus TaxID=27405 RepID=UPI001C70EC8F|nr:uncharacterized protein LOC122253201 [Penaeus japonicus]
MRKALSGFEGSITVHGQQITNLRYADDVVLIAGSMDELQDPKDRVRLESEKSGLMLNAKKTKVMKIRRKTTDHDNGNIKINNEYIQNVKQFTYLGVVFTDNYDDTIEIKRRLAIARNATRTRSVPTRYSDDIKKPSRDMSMVEAMRLAEDRNGWRNMGMNPGQDNSPHPPEAKKPLVTAAIRIVLEQRVLKISGRFSHSDVEI